MFKYWLYPLTLSIISGFTSQFNTACIHWFQSNHSCKPVSVKFSTTEKVINMKIYISYTLPSTLMTIWDLTAPKLSSPFSFQAVAFSLRLHLIHFIHMVHKVWSLLHPLSCIHYSYPLSSSLTHIPYNTLLYKTL